MIVQRIYATASDYYGFVGEDDPNGTIPPPDEAVIEKDLNARLRRSSGVIDSLTRTSSYTTDEDGYPADAGVSDAFTEATCAQAQWFFENDDITGSVSAAGPLSLGPLSVGGRGNTAAAVNSGAQPARIAPEAVQILRNAGLLGAAVSHS